MYITINVYEFRDAFHRMDRGNQFSYEGLEVLFDYLEELEHCEEPLELDVIVLCCDFDEDEPRAIAESYSIDTQGMDDDEVAEAVREYLDGQGVLVGETDCGTFVYHQH